MTNKHYYVHFNDDQIAGPFINEADAKIWLEWYRNQFDRIKIRESRYTIQEGK